MVLQSNVDLCSPRPKKSVLYLKYRPGPTAELEVSCLREKRESQHQVVVQVLLGCEERKSKADPTEDGLIKRTRMAVIGLAASSGERMSLHPAPSSALKEKTVDL